MPMIAQNSKKPRQITYFKDTANIYDTLHTELIARMQVATNRELRDAIEQIIAGHVRDRGVLFEDYMGCVSIEIEHRLGGTYEIYSDGCTRKAHAHDSRRDAPALDRLDWISELQALIVEYVYVNNNLYRLSVVIQERTLPGDSHD